VTLGLVLLLLGYTLVYAGVKDEAPWDEITKGFGF